METVSVTSSTTPGVPVTTTKESCEKMEYIQTLIDTKSITMQPDNGADTSKLNSTGINFDDNNQRIVINVPNAEGINIQDIKLYSDNVKEIRVTMTNSSNISLPPVSGNPVDLPREVFPINDIVKMIIEILSTTDNSSAKSVTLSIIACAPAPTTPVTEGNSRFSLCLPYANLSPR